MMHLPGCPPHTTDMAVLLLPVEEKLPSFDNETALYKDGGPDGEFDPCSGKRCLMKLLAIERDGEIYPPEETTPWPLVLDSTCPTHVQMLRESVVRLITLTELTRLVFGTWARHKRFCERLTCDFEHEVVNRITSRIQERRRKECRGKLVLVSRDSLISLFSGKQERRQNRGTITPLGWMRYA